MKTEKFLGLPQIWSDMNYDSFTKVWAKTFKKRFPDVDKDKEFEKIGGKVDKKKTTK